MKKAGIVEENVKKGVVTGKEGNGNASSHSSNNIASKAATTAGFTSSGGSSTTTSSSINHKNDKNAKTSPSFSDTVYHTTKNNMKSDPEKETTKQSAYSSTNVLPKSSPQTTNTSTTTHTGTRQPLYGSTTTAATSSNLMSQQEQQQPPTTKMMMSHHNPMEQPTNSTSTLIPQPLVNKEMKQIITDILILLQTYGPLTLHQIEYNLPFYVSLCTTLNTTTSTSTSTTAAKNNAESLNQSNPSLPLHQQQQQPQSTTATSSSALDEATAIAQHRLHCIQNVLNVLAVIHVIHKTNIPYSSLMKSFHSKSSTTNYKSGRNDTKELNQNESQNSGETSTQTEEEQMVTVYYFHDGKVRSDVIYPWDAMDLIQDANQEINESCHRIELLKQELGMMDKMDVSGSGSGSGSQQKQQEVQSKEKAEEAIISNDKRLDVGKSTSAPATTTKAAVSASASSTGGFKKANKAILTDTILSSTIHENHTKTPMASSIPPSQRMKTTREFFKTLVNKFPDIVFDPVYNAALRNFNVDLGCIERERQKYMNSMSGGAVGSAGSGNAVSIAGGTIGNTTNSGGSVGGGGGRKSSSPLRRGGGSSTHGSSSKRRSSSTNQGTSSGKKRRRKTTVKAVADDIAAKAAVATTATTATVTSASMTSSTTTSEKKDVVMSMPKTNVGKNIISTSVAHATNGIKNTSTLSGSHLKESTSLKSFTSKSSEKVNSKQQKGGSIDSGAKKMPATLVEKKSNMDTT
mmetsp:Transcript_23208/g.26423  ORF Transcript_23208/g.26423 Transcript_23208/m.26423 type:complete len:744 (-) Transcript_23208:153-2384(-)